MAQRGNMWWLAACLGCALSGCMKSHDVRDMAAESSAAGRVDAALAKMPGTTILPAGSPVPLSEPKAKTPKVATVVKLGNLRAEMALDKSQTPTQRDILQSQALAAYTKALSMEPKNADALRGLARLHSARQERDKAIATFRKAIDQSGKDAALWCDLGLCQARFQEWEPALESLQTAAQLQPDNREIGKLIGFTLARAGRYEEAIAWFGQTMPEDQAHYSLAQMLYQNRQDEAALRELQIALKLNPQNAHANATLVAWQTEPQQPGTPTTQIAQIPQAVPSSLVVRNGPFPAATVAQPLPATMQTTAGTGAQPLPATVQAAAIAAPPVTQATAIEDPDAASAAAPIVPATQWQQSLPTAPPAETMPAFGPTSMKPMPRSSEQIVASQRTWGSVPPAAAAESALLAAGASAGQVRMSAADVDAPIAASVGFVPQQ